MRKSVVVKPKPNKTSAAIEGSPAATPRHATSRHAAFGQIVTLKSIFTSR